MLKYSDTLKKGALRYHWLWQALAFILFYAVWVFGFRLLSLTLITYFTISPTAHFQDISDAISSYEVNLAGLSSLLFVALLAWINPLKEPPLKNLFEREQIEKNFLPGLWRGAIFAGSIILIFVLIGIYKYLGYFIQFDEAPLELANVALRMIALSLFAFCEQYLFHHKLLKTLPEKWPEIGTACFIAVFYSAIKWLQFDLGLMHLVSLFLISICLYYRSTHPKTQRSLLPNYPRGAGFWAATLIVFQPILSLPLFGTEFSGILLLRYDSTFHQQVLAWTHLNQEQVATVLRFFSGGAGGPLSSFAFQLALFLDIIRNILTRKTKA